MTIDFDLSKIKITPILETLQLEDISDSEYFSERYKEYISNSRLGLLKKEGVKAFFEGIKSSYNSSFELGSLIHEIVLQPEVFEVIKGVFKPTAKAGLMADYLYKPNGIMPSDDEIKAASYIIGYYKDKLTTNRLKEFKQKAEPYWRDRFIYEQNNPFKEGDKERIYTNEGNYNLLVSCLNSLNENKEIQNLLHPTGVLEDPYVACERAILLDIKAEIEGYEPRIFKLKAKLDNFSLDKEENLITVNDLKTTSRPAVEFDPTYYSYQREIASYTWLLKMCAKKFFNMENSRINGNFLVVSTIPEYNSLVYPMTSKLFMTGWKEYLHLLRVVIYFSIIKGYEFK